MTSFARFASIRPATVARKVIGLGLVLAAFAGTARAIDVPEIDPGSIGGALALLSGGVMLITNRRRSK